MELKNCYNLIRDHLNKAGVEDSVFEAKQLIKDVLKIDDAQLLTHRIDVSDEKVEKLCYFCKQRCNGYPLQYILGEWEFYGLPFLVGEGVLIPRQDTETLCEWVIQHFSDRKGLKILDLCTGSGCIAITLEKYLVDSCVWALEKSSVAAEYCKKNIVLHNSKVKFILDDALNPSFQETRFDIIVSNPPYLSKEDMNQLQTEVSFEPEQALYAGQDGLDFYRKLTEIWSDRLVSGGALVYEIGINQQEAVCTILKQKGFDIVGIQKDLCGIERVVFGIKS